MMTASPRWLLGELDRILDYSALPARRGTV